MEIEPIDESEFGRLIHRRHPDADKHYRLEARYATADRRIVGALGRERGSRRWFTILFSCDPPAYETVHQHMGLKSREAAEADVLEAMRRLLGQSTGI